MAQIRPFRAWRYQDALGQRISTLISPPLDTISDKQRSALYQQPYNSIHLAAPPSSERAALTLRHWKAEGILLQDREPALYGYYQYFKRPNEEQERCRKGFICFIEAHEWSQRVVLRHEDTLPSFVEDRVALLTATQLNASPTHGLYTDPSRQLEKIMDASMSQPVYQVEDYQGGRNTLSMIHDPSLIRQFADILRSKPIILADGHHRYESSLIYRRRCEGATRTHRKPGCRYHMMYLTNTEAEDLRILPTHRLIRGLAALNKEWLMQKVEQYFRVQPVENASDIPEVIEGKHWAFGLLIGDDSYKIRLKPEVFSSYKGTSAMTVEAVDTAVLHHFFIDLVLGIPRAEQRRSDQILYERSLAHCYHRLARQEVQIALITQGVSMEQIKQVSYSGQTMPQKSTYFYPKAVAGLVFGSINDDEL